MWEGGWDIKCQLWLLLNEKFNSLSRNFNFCFSVQLPHHTPQCRAMLFVFFCADKTRRSRLREEMKSEITQEWKKENVERGEKSRFSIVLCLKEFRGRAWLGASRESFFCHTEKIPATMYGEDFWYLTAILKNKSCGKLFFLLSFLHPFSCPFCVCWSAQVKLLTAHVCRDDDDGWQRSDDTQKQRSF